MQRLLPISPGSPALLESRAEGLYRAGVRQLLVREKHMRGRPLVAMLNRLTQRFDLIVHARCRHGEEIAREAGYGLHLPGVSDVAAVRARFSGLLGYSAHSDEDVLYAQAAGADYVTLSPIYRPTSKPDDDRPPLGPEVAQAVQRAVKIKVFALGGVTPERFTTLRTGGVYGVGVLGGLFLTEDTEQAARDYLTVSPASQLDLLR
jgi:thiamine-phosphate pyrophosphorylase